MKASYLKTRLLLVLVLALLGLGGSLIVPSSAANATTERCHPHDKRALLRIKQQSFNNSIFFDSWDPNTDCCNGWFNVRCSDSTNRIISFIVLSTDTEGTPFPSALGDLPYLEEVFFHNKATGPIPNSLAKLRRIILLILSINLLTGPIPSFFSGFQNLHYLDLSNNLLSGIIPPSLGLAPSLQTLLLSRNKLTGPIPESFGSFNSSQIELLLNDNLLSGEIPRSLERVKFYSIEVSGNKLKGDASFLFGKDKTVSTLILSDNSFSFDMTNLGFPHMLNILRLSHNKIYGSLPKGLAHLPQLGLFNVSYNQLCGRIPTGGTLKQFDMTTYFHNKCLCGTPLPPCK